MKKGLFSSCVSWFSFIARLAVLAISGIHAQENSTERIFGLDYSRYVWQDFGEGMRRSGTDTGSVVLEAGSTVPWLLSQRGSTSYEHIGPAAWTSAALRPVKDLALKTRLTYQQPKMSFSGDGLSARAAGQETDVEQNVTYGSGRPARAGVHLAVNSHRWDRPAQFKGFLETGFPPVLRLKAGVGIEHYEIPLSIGDGQDLDLSMPLVLEKFVNELSAVLKMGRLEVSLGTKMAAGRYPGKIESEFTAGDSGSTVEDFAAVEVGGKTLGLSLAYSVLTGRHAFKGYSRLKGLDRYFSYQEILLEGQHGKMDLHITRGSRVISLFTAGSRLRLDARRPWPLAHHYSFETNNFIESYQGPLRNIFAGEQYLLEGRNELSQWSSGITYGSGSAFGRFSLGLMHTRFRFHSWSTITRRETTLILFSSTRKDNYEVPAVTLHLVTPSIVLEKKFGRAGVNVWARQGVPVYYHQDEAEAFPEDAGVSAGPVNREKIRGGAEAGVFVDWAWK